MIILQLQHGAFLLTWLVNLKNMYKKNKAGFANAFKGMSVEIEF